MKVVLSFLLGFFASSLSLAAPTNKAWSYAMVAAATSRMSAPPNDVAYPQRWWGYYGWDLAYRFMDKTDHSKLLVYPDLATLNKPTIGKTAYDVIDAATGLAATVLRSNLCETIDGDSAGEQNFALQAEILSVVAKKVAKERLSAANKKLIKSQAEWGRWAMDGMNDAAERYRLAYTQEAFYKALKDYSDFFHQFRNAVSQRLVFIGHSYPIDAMLRDCPRYRSLYVSRKPSPPFQ